MSLREMLKLMFASFDARIIEIRDDKIEMKRTYSLFKSPEGIKKLFTFQWRTKRHLKCSNTGRRIICPRVTADASTFP